MTQRDIIAGILMFFGGAALLGSSQAPQNHTAPQNQPASLSPAPASTAAAVPPTTTAPPIESAHPVFAAPQADSMPAPATERQTPAVEETQAITAPVKNRARPQPVAPQPTARDDGGAVYYKNCAEARATGAAPLHKGEAGYRPELDRDHDGTACE
jgi:hypothetical protein